MTTPGGGKRCAAKIRFPKRLHNRPALPRIDYRIGSYADIRERLLRDLDLAPELLAWTHREADDPGIALLEGASMLGDILTFYQDLYANEAFLRTAQWRDSVADLVQLLGYRLSPGLGGRGTFAVEVKGDKALTIPAGFPLQADLEKADDPVRFETLAATVAYPWLSKFNLYRPLKRPIVSAGAREFRLISSEQLELEPDDRLLLAAPWPWSSLHPVLFAPEVVVVEEAWTLHGQEIVRVKGSLRLPFPMPALRAYKLGRSFHHFGHNAPRQEVVITSGSAEGTYITYDRSLASLTSGTHLSPSLAKRRFPLEPVVDDLPAGSLLICDTRQRRATMAPALRWTVVRTIENVASLSVRWGSLTGQASLVALNDTINLFPAAVMDIRRVEFHEVLGKPFRVQAAPVDDTSQSVGKDLFWFGSFAKAKQLKGRRVLLSKKGSKATVSTVVDVVEDDSGIPAFPKLHRVKLADQVTYADFPQQKPSVGFYGNLVDADQGKTEKDAILGDGDNRQSFQTFKLPKKPLTHHYESQSTPPEVPELEIWVDGRLWKRVDSLFGQGPRAEVYIVRSDEAGNNYVQFGDGKLLGARLPTGYDNVFARYRTGIGAYGAQKADTKVLANERLEGLDKVELDTVISGGEQPETADKARRAAPGRVQSMNRVVSLQDFESEALAIAGVALASARWGLEDNVPSVIVTVLMASGRENEFESVRAALDKANRCRGPHRHPVIVRQGLFEYVYLEAQLALVPGRLQQPILKAVKEALGVAGEQASGIDGGRGLFSLDCRRFGESEYRTRVTATIQNVDGVAWSKIKALQGVGTTATVPVVPELQDEVACPTDSVLRLENPIGLTAVDLKVVSSGTGGGATDVC